VFAARNPLIARASISLRHVPDRAPELAAGIVSVILSVAPSIGW
jgi:hypothetical protein